MLKHGIDDKAIQDKLAVIIQETKISSINLDEPVKSKFPPPLAGGD